MPTLLLKIIAFCSLFLYLALNVFTIYLFLVLPDFILKIVFFLVYLSLFLLGLFIFYKLLGYTSRTKRKVFYNLLVEALNCSNEHIVITDSKGFILFANKAVEKITGYKIKDVIGKKAGSKQTWGGVMPTSFYLGFWKKIKKGEKFSGIIKNKRKSGAFYDASIVVHPIKYKNNSYFVGVEHNLSYERALDKMKTDFISLASHQLRTPLSAMKWYIEMLLAGDAGPLTEEQKNFIQNINGSNERMIELINSLLSISRVESGRLTVDPKPTNVIEVVEDVIADVKPTAQQGGLTFIFKGVPSLPIIISDAKLLRNVYMNLLTNAIKYTPKGGTVSLTIKKTNTHIVNIVEDTGIGISKKDQKKIFSRFFRAENARSKVTDGNGLGLYLAKSVISVLRGDISFTSTVGKGTTFTFSLPIKGLPQKKGEVTIDA